MLLNMNKKGIVIGLVLLVLACAGTVAQDANLIKPQILINLSEEIIQPVQVENLLKMQIANNRLQKGIPGYRIRIFSQSGQTARQKADETRMNFMKNFPDMEAYLGFNTPNFQVFVGDFRTKSDAFREKKRIERSFPGAFIVSEIINLPK